MGADAPVTRDVPVTVIWNGTKKDSATVHLLATVLTLVDPVLLKQLTCLLVKSAADNQ